MGNERKKKRKIFLQQQRGAINAKGPVMENIGDNGTYKEVDDKLIGDDFEMAIVKEDVAGNQQPPDKNENNY